MPEQARPSPKVLRNEILTFLREWGENSDTKRIMARIDDGKIIPYEIPVEFSAIYDAITLLSSCSLKYEIEEIQGYEGTQWVVFTMLYHPVSVQVVKT
jgi:hypothetical protein